MIKISTSNRNKIKVKKINENKVLKLKSEQRSSKLYRKSDVKCYFDMHKKPFPI